MKERLLWIDQHLFLITYGFDGFDSSGFFIEKLRLKDGDRWANITELFKDELINVDFELELKKTEK